MRLINYIKENRVTILLIIGFIFAFSGYSFYPFLWSDDSFFHLITLAFISYIWGLYFSLKGKASLVAFIALMTAINSFIDELLFDPQIIELNEYIGFVIIIIITLRFKNTWKRL